MATFMDGLLVLGILTLGGIVVWTISEIGRKICRKKDNDED